MKKILLSIIAIGLTLTATISLASAFFSDTETSVNNTLQSGTVDLLVDNESYYNGVLWANTSWSMKNLTIEKFLNFTDIKPSDWGEDTISLHVNDNNAWMCADLVLTSNNDHSSTEPELLVDQPEDDNNNFDGELGQNVNFYFWVDDGDNVLETDETIFKNGNALNIFDGIPWTLADSVTNLFENSGPLLGAKTYYIGKAWCFGNLSENRVPQDDFGKLGNNGPIQRGSGVNCDGSTLNNSTQTDVLTGDISFRVEQARNNDNFMCSEIECNDAWASSVITSSQGKRKNGIAVLPDRSNPSSALGPAQSLGTPSDSPIIAGSFYSLGFTNGSIVLSYANPFFDKPGPDIQVYEVTGGSYPDEKLKVEASKDGVNWTVLANSVARDAQVDMNPMVWARYLRLTDVSDIDLFEPTADAYDLDGVKVFCGTP